MSVNEIKMITSLISEIAEGRQGSSTSDGAASRMSNEAVIDFLLESDSDLSSLSEESSDEEDKNDISIDSETEEEIILEEHEYIIIGNIDEETGEAPDASHQTVEKDTRKRPANTSKVGQNKRKKPTDKYEGIKWQKEPPIGGIKRLFIGVPGISTTVATGSQLTFLNLRLLMNL